MQCEFIASRNVNSRNLKLFRIGEYQYEICELINGGFQRVKLLVNHGVEQAISVLEAMQ